MNSTCKSCGAEVHWVTFASGKKMPCDLASKEMRIVTSGLNGHHGSVRPTYVSHFATCPHAEQHRKDGAA